MIYFIECGDYIKIGYSTDRNRTRRRIAAIRVSNPYPVRLLFTAWGDIHAEQHLHQQFKKFHHKGEWFHKTPESLEWVASAVKALNEHYEQHKVTIDARSTAKLLGAKAVTELARASVTQA